MLRCAWPDARLGTDGGAAAIACPAAEKTISQPFAAKRGVWRYHQVSLVLKKGRALVPSMFAVQMLSG